jgi:hypothetical protein
MLPVLDPPHHLYYKYADFWVRAYPFIVAVGGTSDVRARPIA